MTDCPDCSTAKTHRHWGGYRLNCAECRARIIASSPVFYSAEISHKVTVEYKLALSSIAAESIEEAHRMVKRWRDTLDSLAAKENA